MNIRVDLNTPISDGMDLVFRSPVDCSQITGLVVYYKEGNNTCSKVFAFSDAHGNNVGDIDHLFAENVVVKVILDVTSGMAFVQNADTNAYIEKTFVKTINGKTPDKNGNVDVAGGGGSGEVDMEKVLEYLRDHLTAEDIGAISNDGRNVANANIAFGAVTTGTLANKAVTAEKLADDVIPGIVSDVLEQVPTGEDGISATHSWNGTVLTIASSSGTSSADLKGEKGEKGDTGATGADGYSPIRGTDYWTEADKAEIKSYVDNAILGGAW